MKVAYLLGSLNRGGTETLLLDVFKNASKADFDFVGIYRKDGLLRADFYATNQKFIKLTPKFPFDIFYLFKLRKTLKREKINIVHSQQFIDAFYAKIATLFTTIKVVQTYHGFEKEHFLLKFIIRKTDKNLFVSNYQRELYIKKYNLKSEKQAVVYNGISFDKFLIHHEKTDLPEKYGNGLKLAMVGNFVLVRDQLTICKFLKLLVQKDVKFDFYFVGKQSDNEIWRYNECVDFCKKNQLDNVHFLGSRNDIPAILKQMNAFVYSTNHDTFGIAVVEAIACGLPTFVNDWVVMSEITEDGKYATIYKTKDVQDLLQKFTDFFQNRDIYFQKAKEAATFVREKYSIEKHIAQLNNVYNTLSSN